VISVLRRSRCELSPLTSTLLVRSSATIFTVACRRPRRCAGVEGVDDAYHLGGARVLHRDDVDVLVAVWSMRSMMRTMRLTFEARSEMISMFETG